MPPADGPLIVQSDRTVLLEVAHPAAEDARHDLAVFAELERAPEHIHTYRITRLGLWNARAAGHTAEDMLATLTKYSRLPRLSAGTAASSSSGPTMVLSP
jgi:DNA excision repair protein ERCC-3